MAEINAATLREIRSMVQLNDHGQAYQFASNKLGLDKLAASFAEINRKHVLLGYLSHDLYVKRFELYREMMDSARNLLDQKTFAKFYMCF